MKIKKSPLNLRSIHSFDFPRTHRHSASLCLFVHRHHPHLAPSPPSPRCCASFHPRYRPGKRSSSPCLASFPLRALGHSASDRHEQECVLLFFSFHPPPFYNPLQIIVLMGFSTEDTLR